MTQLPGLHDATLVAILHTADGGIALRFRTLSSSTLELRIDGTRSPLVWSRGIAFPLICGGCWANDGGEGDDRTWTPDPWTLPGFRKSVAEYGQDDWAVLIEPVYGDPLVIAVRGHVPVGVSLEEID